MSRRGISFLALLWLEASLPAVADEVKVLELRLQQVGEITYFHVRLEPPKDLQTGRRQTQMLTLREGQRDVVMQQAKLVPQDGKTIAVYRRGGDEWLRNLGTGGMPLAAGGMPSEVPETPRPLGPGETPRQVPQQVPVAGLEFIGKVKASGTVKFLLLYPWLEENMFPAQGDTPAKVVRRRGWKEVPVTLDLATATKVAVPSAAAQRQPTAWPVKDDLEGLWAVAQGEQLLTWESVTPNFGFYSFARIANSRKYGVPPLGGAGMVISENRSETFVDPQLYEMTTGAAALAESLAQRRLLRQTGKEQERTVPIASLQGIDIAEHPWEKMMAGKQPATEPLARFIPHDQYYVSFKTFRAFLDTSDLFDHWGTAITQAYEVKSREYRLKERYEKQLCLHSTLLGRTLGPAVIRSMAFTGSDLYFREGTDLAILFEVVNDQIFRTAVEPFLAEARKEFGPQLKEAQTEYLGIKIESFVTPQREVSLHRATVGKVVVYANSAVGLRRIIDAQQKKTKCLADSLDFQYMRTVFRADEANEDGFAFFSDAFIRQLVGPASKIKERRRLDAYTSLQMLHHAALYAAWENGSIPTDLAGLMNAAKLTGKDLLMPEGPPADWHGDRKQAYSATYNTLHFLTPLCELPIEKVTETEQREYEQFRQQYLGLWRQYFDPVGMRLAQRNGRLTLDTYILPLIQSTAYEEMRRLTGGGVTTLDLRSIPSTTILQFMTHLSPQMEIRQTLSNMLSSFLGKSAAVDWLGSWFFVRLEDSPEFAKLAQLIQKQYLSESETEPDLAAAMAYQKSLFQLPLTLGVEIKNPLVFAGILTTLRTAALNALPGNISWEPVEPKYKDVAIVRVKANVGRMMGGGQEDLEPSLYYVLVDGGFYISLQEDCIKRVIDQAIAKRENKGKQPEAGQVVQLNSGLYLSPSAAQSAMQLVNLGLGFLTHEYTLENSSVYAPLYQAGLLAKDASAEEQRRLAFQYFGFIPVSPDGTAYQFDSVRQEVVNAVHGSLRQPKLPEKPVTDLPLQKMLAEVLNLRLDLRFREDGIHTVVTLNRQAKGK
jgi:hypothetical protein